MAQMTLEARARLIGGELATFLRQFATPNHLTDETLQLDRIRATAEAINARIPADFTEQSVGDRLGRAFRHVLSTHKHSGWPAVAVFVEAMDHVAKDGKQSTASFTDTFKEGAIDPMLVAAKRIRNNEPVGDGYLYGRQARELVADYGITEAQINKARRALEHDAAALYGDGTDAFIANLLRRHEASA